MNIKRLIPCFLLIGSLLLGSCENEQITDMEKQGTELPEGKYPLTFTAVQAAPEGTPQTRVSEHTDGMSSHWDGGEVIKVQIAGGKAGTYTLDESGNATAQTPCYWQNPNNATINAWYSNISGQATENNADKTVNLSNQSKGLAYVLKATVNDVNYNSQNIELQFHHQLAKVRVKPKGDKANDVTGVQVNNYTSCTVTNGNVSGGSTGYIPMRKNGEYYEANLVPMKSITADDFIRLNNETQASISGISKLEAGNVYTIEIDCKPEWPKDISTLPDGEYTVSGDAHLIGDGTTKNLNLIMEAGAKLTLENVNLSPNGGDAITCNGDASITLKGDNVIISNGIGIYVKGGTLTIDGDNTSSMTVTGNGLFWSAGIGAANNANITINGGKIKANEGGKNQSAGIGCAGAYHTCGTITINGGIIESWGGDYSAGIGGSNEGACGDIFIYGGNIKAYGGLQTAGIGNGDNVSCGNITISGANTVVYAKKGSGMNPASIGWNNYNGSCGKVTIGSECTVTQE